LNAKNNIDILCTKAKASYYSYDIPAAYEWCLKAIRQDPLYFDIIPVYVSCLAELNQVAELYSCAHNLIDNYHGYALSWFAVGTYYFLIKKYDLARKYFQKAI
jgi:anaphase-promoting complex subunit 6